MLIDYDNAQPPQYILDAANIVCRRGNNYHVYFTFKPIQPTKENIEKYKKIAKQIVSQTGGDPNAVDATRIVRLPFFKYRKNNVNEQGYIIEKISSNRMSIDDTFKFLHDAKNFSGENIKIDNGREDFLIRFYSKKSPVPAGSGRSKILYSFGCDCHGWGIDIERAKKLARKINLILCLPPESEDVVDKQVESAYKYRKAAFGNYLNSFDISNDSGKAEKQLTIMHAVSEKFADWVYCHEAERFINTKTGVTLTKIQQITLYLSQVVGERVNFASCLMSDVIRTVHRLDYRPDEDMFFSIGDVDYYNTYRPVKNLPRSIVKDVAIQTFNDHIKYLTNNAKETAWLSAWLAYIVQNPGKKVMWAPLIISQQTGIGKSALIELMKKIFGEWNVSEVSSYDLLSQHTDYMADKMLVASHEVELAEKEAMHRLKNLITEKKVRIVQKYARTYEATNCANFIFLSNRPDALKIDEEDRRLFVIYNTKQPNEQQYYENLFHVIQEGAGHIYDYLCSISLSGFDPYRRPPVTEGKEIVISNTESELSHYLRGLADEGISVFAKDYFQTRELVDYVHLSAPKNISRFCSTRMVQLWLSKNGYKSHALSEKKNGDWRRTCYWSKKMTRDEILAVLKKTHA